MPEGANPKAAGETTPPRAPFTDVCAWRDARDAAASPAEDTLGDGLLAPSRGRCDAAPSPPARAPRAFRSSRPCCRRCAHAPPGSRPADAVRGPCQPPAVQPCSPLRAGGIACGHVCARIFEPSLGAMLARACSCIHDPFYIRPTAPTLTVLVCCSPRVQSRAGLTQLRRAWHRGRQTHRMLRHLVTSPRRLVFAGPSSFPRLRQTAATHTSRETGGSLLGRRACRERITVPGQETTRSCARARGRRTTSATGAGKKRPTGFLPTPPSSCAVAVAVAVFGRACSCCDTCCVLHVPCSIPPLCQHAVGGALTRTSPAQSSATWPLSCMSHCNASLNPPYASLNPP